MDCSPLSTGPPKATGNASEFNSSPDQNISLPITTENETTTVTSTSQAVLPSIPTPTIVEVGEPKPTD